MVKRRTEKNKKKEEDKNKEKQEASDSKVDFFLGRERYRSLKLIPGTRPSH
jgi:hypothetical protein